MNLIRLQQGLSERILEKEANIPADPEFQFNIYSTRGQLWMIPNAIFPLNTILLPILYYNKEQR